MMNRDDRPIDPYAAPPLKRDKSGAVVRVAILAALLAAGAWGYASLAQPDHEVAEMPLAQTAPALTPAPQQTADASAFVQPEAAPASATPAPRRAAPAAPEPEAEPELTPAPVTNTPPAEATTPAPIEPIEPL